MAFNNGFPVGYPQMYYPQQPAQQAQNNIIWVQGEAGAKGYLVAPNSSVALFDNEQQVVYIKSADASGMPSMKVLDYKIREQGGTNHYADFEERLNKLQAEIEELKGAKQ